MATSGDNIFSLQAELQSMFFYPGVLWPSQYLYKATLSAAIAEEPSFLGGIREQSNSTHTDSKIWNSPRKTNGGEKSNAPSVHGISQLGKLG